jgi:carbamoyl-phosphate synthase large subunit
LNKNILLLSAGRKVKLFRHLENELQAVFPDALVIAADAVPEHSAVCHITKNKLKVPYTTDMTFYEKLPLLCRENKIGLIIPTTDFDTNALITLADQNMLPEDTEALVSTKDFILKCQDKVLTCTIFESCGVEFLMPLHSDYFEYPLFMKPRYGFKSEDCRVINDEMDLPRTVLDTSDYSDYIFQYYLSPDDFEEYSIDCYYNKNGELLCSVPRLRMTVRGGEVSKCVTIKNEIYTWVWQYFNSLPGAKGPINLQCFLNLKTKDIVAGEINPRFASGYTLSHQAGANYARYIVEEYLLSKTVLPITNWKENLLMLRYDEEILIQR